MQAHNGARLQTTNSPLSLRFTHRPLDNGSVESICMNCLLTISRTWGNFKLTAEELNEIESAHECEPRRKPIKPQDSN
jgi:hypothetical protein